MEGENHDEQCAGEFHLKSYGDLSKVRYFHPIFWLHSVEGEKHHEPWAGEFHLRKLCCIPE